MPEAAGSDSPHLDAREQAQAGDNAPLAARVVHEIIREEGEAALERGADALVWSGLAAGLSMGFSFLTEALLQSALPDAPWRKLVAAAGYTVGFLIVILGRQQLFTESTLSALLPTLTRRDLPTLLRTLRVWGWVLGANLAGTWAFAALLAFGAPFKPEVAPALSALAAMTLHETFWGMALKAVLAGWLIALTAWLLPSAGSARLLIIVLITYVVGVAELPHVIAGSTEAAYAVLKGQAGLGDWAWRFFAPTLCGNVVGGALLVAMLNHAPVRSEMQSGGGDGEADED